MDALTPLALSGDDIDDIRRRKYSTPSGCTNCELLLDHFKGDDTVVTTIIVGLNTSSVIVNKLNPR